MHPTALSRCIHLALACGILMLAACGSGGDASSARRASDAGSPPDSAISKPDSATLRRARVASYVGYGLGMFQRMAAARGARNLFFSPVSAGIAFSLATTGATGPTRAELARALRMPDAPAAIDSANAALVAALRASDVELRVGTSLWAQEGAPFLADYLANARTTFHAEVADVDFAGPSAAARINAWASRATAGKIARAVSADPEPGRVLLLLNAVYFKGKWAHQFDPALTGPLPFHVNGGAPQPRPTMRIGGGYRYAAVPGMRALRLPYRGGRFSMVVILPDSGVTLASLVAGLTPRRWAALDSAFAPAPEVEVALPRFETNGSADLVPPMRALGARRVFHPGQARLGAMLPAEYLATHRTWISAATQGVYVKVDEEGTEAAAVTSVESVSDSASTGVPVRFVVDRPFLAAVVDGATGALLFVGQVYDPAETR